MFADDLSQLNILEICPKRLRLPLPNSSSREPLHDFTLNIPYSEYLIQGALPIPHQSRLPLGLWLANLG